MNRKKKPSTEYDSPWKDIIEHFFEDFMVFFFPAVSEQINWTLGHEFLNQELQKVVRESVTKTRRVDKLVKVWLNNGEQALLYIHIEVQSQYESDFAERMFIYHYRLYDRYGPLVTSLAILGDPGETWRPRSYHYETIGSELSFCFTMVKLLDYKDQLERLEKSRNPFAMVVRIHLKALETQKFPKSRYDWKVELFKALHEANYQPESIIKLLGFLDWLLTLPEDLARQFDDFANQYEEAKKVPYVTTFERKGIEKGILLGRLEGIQLGLQQGLQLGTLQKSREIVIDILENRFQPVPKTLVEKIQALDDTWLLSKLFKKALSIESLVEFEQLIEDSL